MSQPTRIQIEDFKTILDEEIVLFSRIEALMKSKKDSIIQGNVQLLTQIDIELEQRTQDTQQLEKVRIAKMVEMGREGSTLRDFITNVAHGEDAQILEEARGRLIEATSAIQNLSRSNHALLTQSIRFIEQSVDVIASLLRPEGASYARTSSSRQSVIDPAENQPIVASTTSYSA